MMFSKHQVFIFLLGLLVCLILYAGSKFQDNKMQRHLYFALDGAAFHFNLVSITYLAVNFL